MHFAGMGGASDPTQGIYFELLKPTSEAGPVYTDNPQKKVGYGSSLDPKP